MRRMTSSTSISFNVFVTSALALPQGLQRWLGLSEQAPGVCKWISASVMPPPLRASAG